MSVAKHNRCWRFDGTIPAYYSAASPALGDEISRTATRFPGIASAASVFHIVPVAGTSAVPQCLLGIDRDFLIAAT